MNEIKLICSIYKMGLALMVFVPFCVSSYVEASPRKVKADYTIKSWHRLMAYTDEARAAGQDHWMTVEQRFQFSRDFSLKAQIYGYVGDSKLNLAGPQDRTSVEQERAEFWPGEVYGQFSSGPVLLRLGYQRVYWQEGFGISYTNFINARDNRVSVFDDAELIFRSAPMANFVASGDQLSFQLIYLPVASLDMQAPVSRWGGRARLAAPLMPVFEVEQADRAYAYKSASDYGARLTWAGEGFDLSIFHAKITDRANVFSMSPASNVAAIVLVPEFNTIDPIGLTSSFSIRDFIARFEYLRIFEKRVNRVSGFNLGSSVLQEDAVTIGLDSPAWPSFMFSIQHSVSILNDETQSLNRNRIENLSFLSVNYNLRSDQILRLALVYLESDQSILGRLSLKWPVSANSEIETSYEGSTGSGSSRGLAMADLNRFFVQLNLTL